MAAVEWTLFLGTVGYLSRHRIGRRLGGWLARHMAPHLAEHIRGADDKGRRGLTASDASR